MMDRNKWVKVGMIGAVAVFIIAFLIAMFMGFHTLWQFFRGLLIAVLIAGAIFLLIYIFWLVFIKKEFKDIPAQYRRKLGSTIKLFKNEMLGDLYLSGDYKHNRIKLGKFFYLRFNLPKTIEKIKTKKIKGIEVEVKDEWGNPIKETYTEKMPIDCFIVKRKGLSSLFNEPLFILVTPEDHNYSSIFNDVTLNGFNLVPLDSQFYTIDKRDLDVDIIKGLAMNYIREVVYEIFKNLDKLVQQAMNLDQEFKKEKAKTLEFELPQLQKGE